MVNMWKEETGNHPERSYQVSQQLGQMAALFTPGHFYFFVFNFHSLQFDYVHPGVEGVLGIKAEECSTERLLEMMPPEELRMMQKKEAVAGDFLFRFLKPEQLPFYKIVYFLRIRDAEGRERKILHQTTTLTVSQTGKVEHSLGVHTDVSHLHVRHDHSMSFISLNGGKSYFNIDPGTGSFDPGTSSYSTQKLDDVLSSRELEVIRLLAKGLNADEVAERLNLSYNTVRTHRKNILSKTHCSNTTELVARCLMEGLI